MMRWRFLVLVVASLQVAGCDHHKVDTYQEWCEQIQQVDLEKRHIEIGAILFSTPVDEEAVRQDFLKFMNDSHMVEVQTKPARMAWQEGVHLHLLNPSSLMVIDQQVFIQRWKVGIEKAKTGRHENPADNCMYGAARAFFLSLHIHSLDPEASGPNWTDSITILDW